MAETSYQRLRAENEDLKKALALTLAHVAKSDSGTTVADAIVKALNTSPRPVNLAEAHDFGGGKDVHKADGKTGRLDSYAMTERIRKRARGDA